MRFWAVHISRAEKRAHFLGRKAIPNKLMPYVIRFFRRSTAPRDELCAQFLGTEILVPGAMTAL